MIERQARPGGRVNLIDLLVLAMLVLAILGVGLARAGKAGLNQQLKGEVTAEMDLLFRGAVSNPSIFKVGDKAFITIRNQPYAGLTIRAVKWTPRSIAVPAGDGTVKAVPDPADPFGKDIVVTLRERAQVTDDALVMGGNKIKVGVPIDLEGFKYRLRGAIIDVRIVEPK